MSVTEIVRYPHNNPVLINTDYPGFECEVIANSISPSMKRIMTMRIRFPRFILAEVNTHRALSRNSASSRAIPLHKFIDMLAKEPYVPIFWGKNQKGMQSGAELSDSEKKVATKVWLETRDMVIEQAIKLGNPNAMVNENGEGYLRASDGQLYEVGSGDLASVDDNETLYNLDVHKETVNRLLEPFMWHTALVTATEWANFFALRTHLKASPAFRVIAELMADAYISYAPKSLEVGEWHTPYADDPKTLREINFHLERQAAASESKWSIADIVPTRLQVSAGRCARVSYLTQDGTRDIIQDTRLHDDLVLRQGDPSLDPAHGSPLEHQARAMDNAYGMSGNFDGWEQYRKTIKYENIMQFTWKGFEIGWIPQHSDLASS